MIGGGLFSRYFLDADGPSEAETEDGLVFPLLRLLGWELLPQQSDTTRRENIPDALLFLDQAQAAAAVAGIRAEHAATVAPMAARLIESARLELELSGLVNRAYGLTAEEEALMWSTAPPRMPIPAP